MAREDTREFSCYSPHRLSDHFLSRHSLTDHSSAVHFERSQKLRRGLQATPQWPQNKLRDTSSEVSTQAHADSPADSSWFSPTWFWFCRNTGVKAASRLKHRIIRA